MRSAPGPEAAAEAPQRAYQAALRWLAVREHAPQELVDKLLRRGFERVVAEATAERLRGEGWLDERRYAEAYVRGRLARGDGPRRIGAGLRQRGVEAADLVEDLGEDDWQRRLRALHDRRYGSSAPGDAAERARRTRYLLGRGYTAGQIARLWRE